MADRERDPQSRMRFRVVRLPDEVVLVDAELDQFDDVQLAAEAHGGQADAALAEGYSVALLLMDPDGDREWRTLLVLEPNGGWEPVSDA